MKIAFVHYHLKTGGVTSVLKSQIAALQDTCQLLVLTGDRSSARLPCPVVEIFGLGYDRPGIVQPPPGKVAEQILKALAAQWPDGCDVMHIHNPILGKNRQFPAIIKRLHQTGINLFLQIHDFAEDGRPETYLDDDYPENCHYGVINSRDADILLSCGLQRTGLHLIPNPVAWFHLSAHRRPDPLVLYPVRAIRRKNVGEAILLSMFFSPDQRLAITQTPNSPPDLASYRDWVAWTQSLRLPIEFAAGQTRTFSSLVEAAESMITTSISEGFGLAFLEPWTAGKPLWGRCLREICTDFNGRGVRLDWLYERIDIPLTWIQKDAFSRVWHAAVLSNAKHYDLSISEEAVTDAYLRMTRNASVDFGMLDEPFQRQVLNRLVIDRRAKADLLHQNPWVSNPCRAKKVSRMVENNRQAILARYGMHRYQDRLLAIYHLVVDHPVSQRIDKQCLCEAFFNLDRFSLLQWRRYDR
jgi:hypothetical protein